MRRLIFAVFALLLAARVATATGFMVPTDRRLCGLELESYRVSVDIQDTSAVTRVVQVFRNQHKRELEAIFAFPLPKGASVSDFKMYVNGELVKGEIMEADKARHIYQNIVRQMKDPGLLEYMDCELLKLSVYPVPPKGKQEVQIEYAQTLDADDDLVEYIFPLKTPHAAARTMQDFTLSVAIQARAGIKNVYSPTHEVKIHRSDDRHVTAGFEKTRAPLDRDFRLYYALSDAEFGASVISYKAEGKDGYFLLLLSPKVKIDSDEIAAKDVAFVIDVSGSMRGEKIEQAKKALEFCVGGLNEKDRFAIVAFSNSVEMMSKELLEAGADNIKKAREFIRGLESGGGTAIDAALAGVLASRKGEDRPYVVVFLTDGKPTVGETNIARIIDNVKDKNTSSTRIFSFGVGYDVNTKLLDELTRITRASNQYVHPDEDIEVKVSSFFKKIGDPLLSEVQVDMGEAGTYDVYPAEPPDLFRGTQLVVAGRYKSSGPTTVVLRGKGASGELVFEYPVELSEGSESAKFVSTIWAGRKIGFLLSEIRLRGENEELKSEVIRLSKEFGIVTPYTSYLVTDGSPVRRRFTREDNSRARFITRAGRAGERRRLTEEERGQALLKRLTPRDGGAAAPLVVSEPVHRDSVIAKGERLRALGYFDAESGKAGVDASETVSFVMKSDKVTGGRVMRKVAGRDFVNIDGVWIESGVKKGLTVVRVKFASDAYFKMFDELPKLKEVFALGDTLVVAAGKYCLIVDEEGIEDADDAEVKAVIEALSK